MSAEEEPMETKQEVEESKEVPAGSGAASGTNENFVVLDMAGDSEGSDNEDKKDSKKESAKASGAASGSDSGTKTPPVTDTTTPKTVSVAPRLRKKPKAPVVDVNSLRKRKWQLKVYPLHAEDLQLNSMSILCKLASESLLYIPSEGRHGKAELYVATQKETAAIIGKLLRMAFHHNLLKIEVVRKDTGGKEGGDESKKECKAFLMFDKYLSKKIFDAKGEKGMLIEKMVTLNKLPKAATKDFIGALFPFATEIEIIENDNPDERKATVKCKTPVTSLLVYKSFKRLEINDVHVKLSVDDSVKAIQLPAMFFTPPEEVKKDVGPPESNEGMNQNSLPRRPMMSSLNRRVQQIKKRALLTRKKPTRGQLMMGQRPNGPDEMVMGGPRPGLLRRPGMGGRFGPDMMKNHGPDFFPGNRDYPGGPGRRRMNDRRNRGDSRERKGRRDDGDSQVTKEMLQLQNQLNQAIKNQIAMLNTAQPGGHMRSETFPSPGGSHRGSLLGHGPRHFGDGPDMGGMAGPTRAIGHHQPEFGGASWSGDRGPRMDRGDRDRPGRNMGGARPDRMGGRGGGSGRMDRPGRPMDRNKRMDGPPGRSDASRGDRMAERGSRERGERDRSSSGPTSRGPRPGQGFGGSSGDRSKDRTDSARAPRSSSRGGRNSDFPSGGRSQRGEGSFNSGSHGQNSSSSRYGDYSNQEGDSGSYYRRY